LNEAPGVEGAEGPLEIGDRSPDGPTPEAQAEVGRRLRRGTVLTAGTIGILAMGTSLPFWDVLALPVFYLLLPTLALAQLPLLETERFERIPVYVGSAAAILFLGWMGLALGLRVAGPEGLGLTLLPGGELLAWSLGLTGGGLLLILLFHPLDRRVRGPHHRILSELLPRTWSERVGFLGLSAAAGTGEELAYRGYALVGIQLLGVGAWPAAVLSSVAFGFLHAYQGPVGIVRTGVMGFVLAVPVVVTGSIVPSMIAHALIDVVAGLVLGGWLVGEADPDPLVPPQPLH
jgi:membrane protease YdiL (CAAX protease family)